MRGNEFEVAERLQELKVADDEGRCIISPVAVGDVVYVLDKGTIVPAMVKFFYISRKPHRIYAEAGVKHFNFRACDIGVKVFKNEEEAVRAKEGGSYRKEKE